jgi:hypothetical protein
VRLGRFGSHWHCIIPLYASPRVFGEPWVPDLTAAILILFWCREAPHLRFLINARAGLAQPAVCITAGVSSFGLLLGGVLFMVPLLKPGQASLFFRCRSLAILHLVDNVYALVLYRHCRPIAGLMGGIPISATLIILPWSPC